MPLAPGLLGIQRSGYCVSGRPQKVRGVDVGCALCLVSSQSPTLGHLNRRLYATTMGMLRNFHLLRSRQESGWQEGPLPPLAPSYTCCKAHPESIRGVGPGMSMDSVRGTDSKRVNRAGGRGGAAPGGTKDHLLL